jgi:hypothetical protein
LNDGRNQNSEGSAFSRDGGSEFLHENLFLPKQNQNSLYPEKSQNQNMNFADVSIFSQGDRIFSQGDRFSCWRWSTLTTMSNDMSWMPGPLGSYMNMVT